MLNKFDDARYEITEEEFKAKQEEIRRNFKQGGGMGYNWPN